jgi:hypothetical protein
VEGKVKVEGRGFYRRGEVGGREGHVIPWALIEVVGGF